jgi:hypothetical protein
LATLAQSQALYLLGHEGLCDRKRFLRR